MSDDLVTFARNAGYQIKRQIETAVEAGAQRDQLQLKIGREFQHAMLNGPQSLPRHTRLDGNRQ